MTGSGFDYSERRYIPISPETAVALAINKGDFFVSRGNGSLHLLGRPVLAQEPPEQIVFPDTMIRLRLAIPNPFPQFVNYLWSSRLLRDQIEKKARTTAGIYKISQRDIESFRLPIPPIQEQSRIVAKIEELFSDLDAGVANLLRVRANLKRYRAAVLKAAVEGKLTEDWRARHPDIEPASVLLERILTSRRHSWEEDQLAKFARSNKTPPIDWQTDYREPIVPIVMETIQLPHGWNCFSIEQLNSATRPISYGVLQPGEDHEGGTELIRVCDIVGGKILADQLKKVHPSISNRYQRTLLQGGEVLLTVVGTIGRTAVVPASLRGANTARAVAVIPLLNEIDPRYFEMALRETSMRARLTRAAHEVARKTLNLEDVRIAWMPIPPLREQLEIVSEVEKHSSVLDSLESQVEANLKRAARLRQAILKRAFEGKLVPQDPTDEPAEQLLARIREQRQAAQPSAKAKAKAPTRRGRPRKGGSATPLFNPDDGTDQGGPP